MRLKNESDFNEKALNEKKLKNENTYKHTSFKDRIVSNRSRTIKKVSMKLRQQGEGINKKPITKTKTRKNGSFNSRHKSIGHQKLSRSWSSGSKCQLNLTEDGSISFIRYPEIKEIEVIEYLPIYPKKSSRSKITNLRIKTHFSKKNKI